MPIELLDGSHPEATVHFRELLIEYADWLGFRCLAGFERELAELPGEYAAPNGAILVAKLDNEPVGCIAIRQFDETSAEVKRLYTRPESRGNGIGRELVAACIQEAQKLGYQKLLLDTLPDLMNSAIHIYEAHGFQKRELYAPNHECGAQAYELSL